MRIEREETWGTVRYDVSTHEFSVQVARDVREMPYVSRPVVLNVDLTFRCNMVCRHCVAKDMEKLLGGGNGTDLEVTGRLIEGINRSPFMVVVITGGEPLLHSAEPPLIDLLAGLEGKGIVVDTNGTLLPSSRTVDMLVKKRVMVRVSWDSPSPNIECVLRRYPNGLFSSPESYMEKKVDLIRTLAGEGLAVAAQTVLHGVNRTDPELRKKLPHQLKALGISSWYLQRFIPSHEVKDERRYDLRIDQYEEQVSRLTRAAAGLGVTCLAKRDRRHNSVFLLVGDGEVFTQSDRKPGGKIRLGNIASIDNYFEYVSSSEHSVRYVMTTRKALADVGQEEP